MSKTESFFVAARGGFNRDDSARIALLAGPYATREEAQTMLQPVSHWAAEHSGDLWAVFYEFGIITLPEGLANSRLGAITPEALGLLGQMHQQQEAEEQEQEQDIDRGLSL